MKKNLDRLLVSHRERTADRRQASLRSSVVLAITGILSVALLVGVWRFGDNWTSQDLQRLHVSASIHGQLTTVHLTLERLEEGNGPVDLSEIPEALRSSRRLARALVEGNDTGLTRNPLEPSNEPSVATMMTDLRILVERFSLLTRLRLAQLQNREPENQVSAGAVEYKRAYAELDAFSNMLQWDLGQRILANKTRSMWAIASILGGWVLLILAAAWSLWLREKQRFRAEQALLDREGQLLQSQKMEAVGRLAGGIAHDINNYLAAIRGQCELVKMKTSEDDPTRRRMDLVLDTSDRASSLIQRLLAFSRRQPVERRVVDLNTVVSDLKPMMERLIGADLQLETRASSQACMLHIDPSQLEQVIVNLLVNAREAMPQGGEVRLTCDSVEFGEDDETRPADLPAGSYVEMRVEDTGRGIRQEFKNRIFEPFFTTKNEASGLGLPTVYGIVTQNGGTIQVESEVGIGTQFRILLPRHMDTGVIVGAGREARGRVPAGQGERLLVVDDHKEFRSSLQELLEEWGYEVETAPDADAAASLFARPGQPFDLVITDVVMPGGSGPELLARLRMRHGAIRALYVSGYTGDEALSPFSDTRQDGFPDDRAVDLLHKPFRFETLARKVRQALEQPLEAPPGGALASRTMGGESRPQSPLPS